MLMAITSVCPPVHSARRANMSRVAAWVAPTWARRTLTRSLQSRSPLPRRTSRCSCRRWFRG